VLGAAAESPQRPIGAPGTQEGVNFLDGAAQRALRREHPGQRGGRRLDLRGRPAARRHEHQLNYDGCGSEDSSSRSESLTDMARPWPQGDICPASLAEQSAPVPGDRLDKPAVRLVWLCPGDY
jgi:hypothetical protein